MKLIQSVHQWVFHVRGHCVSKTSIKSFHMLMAHLMLSYYQHLCSTVCCVGNLVNVSFIQAMINQKFGFYAVSAMYSNYSQETFFFCSQSFRKFSCLLRKELIFILFIFVFASYCYARFD